MTPKGWIKLHRKVLQNPVCTKDPEYFFVWMYLLLNATHTEYKAEFEGETITLRAGQLITGRKVISAFCKVSESKVQRIMKRLETEQLIEQQTTPHKRLVTIVNWDSHQQSEQQSEQQLNNNRTTTEQQLNTNKKVKKVDKVDKVKKDTKVSSKTDYGNPDINNIISYLTERVGFKLDGTIKQNRYDAHNLLRKVKSQKVEEPVELIRAVIDLGMQDKFHSQNLTNVGYLYRNFGKIGKSQTKVKVAKIS